MTGLPSFRRSAMPAMKAARLCPSPWVYVARPSPSILAKAEKSTSYSAGTSSIRWSYQVSM
jgi:hypothetical protein